MLHRLLDAISKELFGCPVAIPALLVSFCHCTRIFNPVKSLSVVVMGGNQMVQNLNPGE
jgi:hypothetical protein